jgi:GDPmannose 4,6-dehydratase
MEKKRAIVCGVSGQDGAYLARLLLEKGYEVVGTSRDSQVSLFANLARLGIKDQVKLVSMVPTDFRSVLQTIVKVNPTEIYNLSGQSSVGFSFLQPVETMESIAIGTLNLLEAIRFYEKPVRFYNAASSECFGDTGELGASEETPFRPKSPYAFSKAAAFWEVANYRDAYGLHASSGVLFNHESPLRQARFVTQKIVQAAKKISRSGKGDLRLGDVKIRRDWGWAPEYVEAMYLMLQQEEPNDYVIATGQTHSLECFVDLAFRCVGLDYKNHLQVDMDLIRPTEIRSSRGLPERAKDVLGWKSSFKLDDIVRKMIDGELF